MPQVEVDAITKGLNEAMVEYRHSGAEGYRGTVSISQTGSGRGSRQPRIACNASSEIVRAPRFPRRAAPETVWFAPR
jgi:hypothetical protein